MDAAPSKGAEGAKMKCDCNLWKDNMDKIAAFLTARHEAGQGGYTGKTFKFCPWCGTELVSEWAVKKVVRVPVLPGDPKPEEKK
jgi:hypothetical protein